MSIRNMLLTLSLVIPISQVVNLSNFALAADGVSLYTPYTVISIPPGESITYTIDVLNQSSEKKNVSISVTSIPGDWVYSLKSGTWNIKQLSVLPGEKKTVNLSVNVPLKVNKGNYKFNVVARGYDVLPLTVNVTKEGTFKTEFTSNQPNMEGHSKSSFTFKTKLINQTGDNQRYSLRASTPYGWNVVFKPDFKQATSVEIETNNSKDITIEITPPENIEAGTYKIPVSAITNTTSATIELEVVITGTFSMELTTPRGLLSTNITAGDEKRVELLVKNTGSADLTNIKFSATKPANWDVIFEPVELDKLEAGKNVQIFATIKADKKAIAGDYATTLSSKTLEVSSQAAFRVSVKTPMFWGWIGILIIAAAIGSLYYLFRKYGRR